MRYWLLFIGAIGGAIVQMLGGWDKPIKWLLIMIMLDYVIGCVTAILKKSAKTDFGGLSSKVGYIGICKKVGMLVVVGISVMLDGLMHTDYIRDSVVIAYLLNEMLSVFENLGLMGVPIPAPITNAIEVLRKKHNEQEVHENE